MSVAADEKAIEDDARRITDQLLRGDGEDWSRVEAMMRVWVRHTRMLSSYDDHGLVEAEHRRMRARLRVMNVLQALAVLSSLAALAMWGTDARSWAAPSLMGLFVAFSLASSIAARW